MGMPVSLLSLLWREPREYVSHGDTYSNESGKWSIDIEMRIHLATLEGSSLTTPQTSATFIYGVAFSQVLPVVTFDAYNVWGKTGVQSPRRVLENPRVANEKHGIKAKVLLPLLRARVPVLLKTIITKANLFTFS